MAAHFHWVIDPSVDDHDLSDYVCDPFAVSPNATCAWPLRNCTFDPHLSGQGNASQWVCLHKTLYPFVAQDAFTAVLLGLCGILAGASGIGGGGLNVPILMLTSDFLFGEAVPISHVAVFGNAIAQNLVNVRRAHPKNPSRPLIDVDVPLVLMPAMLGGNALGVLVAPILPAMGRELLASVLLLYAATKTVLMALKNFRREMREAAVADDDRHATSTASVTPSGGIDAPGRAVNSRKQRLLDDDSGRSSAATPPRSPSLLVSSASVVAIHAAAAQLVRKRYAMRLCALLIVWVLFLIVFLGSRAAGGHGVCSPSRLGWLAAEMLIVIISVGSAARHLQLEQSRREQRAVEPNAQPPIAHNTPLDLRFGSTHDLDERSTVSEGVEAEEIARRPLPGDVSWTARSAVLLPCIAAAVGLVAGLLGLGGGELMAPLLLIVGMLPQVASATSAFMVLFTSSSDIAHYLVEGVLNPDPAYMAAAGALGFTSALVGRLLAISIVSRLSHPSILAFTLGATLYVGLALLLMQMAQQPVDWSVASLC